MTDEQNQNGKADLENSQQGISQEGNLSKDSSAPVTGFSQAGQQSMKSDNASGEEQVRSWQQEVERLKQIERVYHGIIGQNNHPNSYQAENWWNDLCRRQQPTDNDLLFVRKYPYSIILLLDKLEKTLEKERKNWNDWWTGNDRAKKNLEQEVKRLTTELQQKQAELRQKQAELRQQQDKMRALETASSSVQQKNDELELGRARLIKEIATLKTGGENAPRPETLHSTFKELKDQEFKELSSRILKLRSQCNPDAKVERKREIAIIRSKLAEAVLVNGIELSKKGDVTNVDIENLIISLQERFARYVGNNPVDFQSEIDSINQIIRQLTEKSLKLSKDITRASSPGELMWYKKGTEFNTVEHEALVGCVEQGKIEFTVFPGYAVYNGDIKEKRIFEKATVFTALEK